MEYKTVMARKAKSVDREKFEYAVQMLINGHNQKEASEYCGLSVPTFAKRVNQYLNPTFCGQLPEGFFK